VDPLLLDVPESIESERLVLRAPRVGDGATVNEAVVESIDALRPWMPWAKTTPTVDDSERNAREAIAKWRLRSDLPLFLWRKSDGVFVGGSGLHRIDWSVPRFEIGYWCRTSLERQGLVTEAVRSVARMAFDVLHARRVEIRCDARNVRSARVAERAGFVFEARLRNEALAIDGQVRDTLVFALVDEERAKLG